MILQFNQSNFRKLQEENDRLKDLVSELSASLSIANLKLMDTDGKPKGTRSPRKPKPSGKS